MEMKGIRMERLMISHVTYTTKSCFLQFTIVFSPLCVIHVMRTNILQTPSSSHIELYTYEDKHN